LLLLLNNFQQNGAGAFVVPVRYDWLKFGKSSFLLGTNLKIGTEDEYGPGVFRHQTFSK
jgi:hypothetical protein